MKRSLFILALILLLIPILAGCQCRHEWVDATCTEAKSCRLCGQRQGSAPGHSWTDATCDAPKTCSVCGKTEGKALGHNWIDATCGVPATCTLCGLTKDVALEHIWTDATCDTPKTCTLCGVTEGEAPGHDWSAATCTEPKKCKTCAAVEGEALGHSWPKTSCTEPRQCQLCGIRESAAPGHQWIDATCEEPARCANCGATEGEAPGHSWADATPEAPKTCTVCGLTEGDPIYVDDRFIESECEILYGSWRYEVVYSADDVMIPGFTGEYKEIVTYQFDPYGKLTIFTEVADPDAFLAMLAADMAASYYAAQAAEGRDAEAADAYWIEIYGMTIPEYSAEIVEKTIRPEDMNLKDEAVYYVSEGRLYTALYWEDEFFAMDFSIEEAQMTLTNELTGEVIVCEKVAIPR